MYHIPRVDIFSSKLHLKTAATQLSLHVSVYINIHGCHLGFMVHQEHGVSATSSSMQIVFIYSPDFQSFIDPITRVFARFRTHSQKLKPHKYTFFQERVLILGHNVSIKGIETNSNMTKFFKTGQRPLI